MSLPSLAIVLIAAWLLAVGLRFQKSRPVLVGGLAGIGLLALAGIVHGEVLPSAVGLGRVASWPILLALVAVWLAGMLALTPLADRIASRFFDAPPKLGAFRAIQDSKIKLLIGIVIAWILGGFFEELVFRGIVLRTIDLWLSGVLGAFGAAFVAIVVAALGAGVIHLYQGPRAALIIVQLSMLFGLLFVVSGFSLYSVVLCHGLYDTIAFIRFANKSSRFSKFAGEA